MVPVGRVEYRVLYPRCVVQRTRNQTEAVMITPISTPESDRSQHMQMLSEVTDALIAVGRPMLPHVAGIGVVREVAENSSEVELNGSDHKVYVLSIIEKEGT